MYEITFVELAYNKRKHDDVPHTVRTAVYLPKEITNGEYKTVEEEYEAVKKYLESEYVVTIKEILDIRPIVY